MGCLLSLNLALVKQKDEILPHEFMKRDLLLLASVHLLHLLPHFLQMSDVGVHSVRNEQVFNFLNYFIQ